jgi:hypothetical protein
MTSKYRNAAEEVRHRMAIEALANELHRQPGDIRQFYEAEFETLEEGAIIRDFLSVRALRRTREKLRDERR